MIPVLTFLIAVGALLVSILTYRYNVRVRHAEWLSRLYEKFYENDQLKGVRTMVDCDPLAPSSELVAMVDNEDDRLFDYLNFFEFVALLYSQKHLTLDEIKALFGYYLRCLARLKLIRDKIESPTLDFELLRMLLRRLYPEVP